MFKPAGKVGNNFHLRRGANWFVIHWAKPLSFLQKSSWGSGVSHPSSTPGDESMDTLRVWELRRWEDIGHKSLTVLLLWVWVRWWRPCGLIGHPRQLVWLRVMSVPSNAQRQWDPSPRLSQVEAETERLLALRWWGTGPRLAGAASTGATTSWRNCLSTRPRLPSVHLCPLHPWLGCISRDKQPLKVDKAVFSSLSPTTQFVHSFKIIPRRRAEVCSSHDL